MRENRRCSAASTGWSIHPKAGSLFDGIDVTALRGQALRDWRSSCGMIFQQFNLAGRLDVLTNVLMGRINAMPILPALLKTLARCGEAPRSPGPRST